MGRAVKQLMKMRLERLNETLTEHISVVQEASVGCSRASFGHLKKSVGMKWPLKGDYMDEV